MRVVVSTGTDVAAVAVGDHSLLTEFEGAADDFEMARAKACEQRLLWHVETGSDGAYLFHIFVDEEPSETIRPFLQDPQVLDSFCVPTGRLVVAGEEAFIGHDFLRKYPHMGQLIEVPAGEYTFTAFRVEAPDDQTERSFAAAATSRMRMAWTYGSESIGWYMIATILALLIPYFLYVWTMSVAIAAVPLAFVAAMWFTLVQVRRSASFVAAERLYRALELEAPSIVVVLKTVRPNSR